MSLAILPRSNQKGEAERSLIILTRTVVSAFIVFGLYWAQAVFIPLALAVFFTFVATPIVDYPERFVGRKAAVLLVVLIAAGLLGGTGWLVTHQVARLAQELPQYTDNIKEKIKSVRQVGQGALSSRFERMVIEVSGELQAKSGEVAENPKYGPEPRTAVRQQLSPNSGNAARGTDFLPGLLGAVTALVEPFGVGGLVVILVIFMLIGREDMRDRFLRVAGDGRMTVTTKALEDAGQRISRYLLMQFIVNASYGFTLFLGLFLLGVNYALLWGFLAAVLRYIPYIGAWIAAVLPIALSLAISPGWAQPISVISLFLVLELISNNVIEPWLYGQSIGVSEVALLISAAFWTFLWGPIGLILSAPLTVCLVVLGKHVPQMKLFGVLLGDEPALTPEVSFYQRLLAMDTDEATLIAEAYNDDASHSFDGLVVQALTSMRHDRKLGNLTASEEEHIIQAAREIVEDIGPQSGQIVASQNGISQISAADEIAANQEMQSAGKVLILGCSARDEADELGLVMLKQLLDPSLWEMELAPVKLLSSELLALMQERQPALICIASIPPGGLAHIRYLCKRMRSQFPDTRIVVGRWGFKGDLTQTRAALKDAGADWVGASLREAATQLNAWHPVFADRTSGVSAKTAT